MDDMSMDDWIQLIPLILLFGLGISTFAPELSKEIKKDIFGEALEETKQIKPVEVTKTVTQIDPTTGKKTVMQVTETKQMSIGRGLVENFDKANIDLWKFVIRDHCMFSNISKSIMQMAGSTSAENNPALNTDIVQRCTEVWQHFGRDLWTDTNPYVFSNIYFTRGGNNNQYNGPLVTEYNFAPTNDEVPDIRKLVHPNIHDSAITFAYDKTTHEMVWMEIKHNDGAEPTFIKLQTFGPNDRILLLARTKAIPLENGATKNVGVDVIFHDIRNSQKATDSHIRALWHKRFFFDLQNNFVNDSNKIIKDAQKNAGKDDMCNETDLFVNVLMSAKSDPAKQIAMNNYEDSWKNIRDYIKLVMIAGFYRFCMWDHYGAPAANVMLFTNSGPGGTPIDALIQFYRNPIPAGMFKDPENEQINLSCSPNELATGLCFHQASRKRRSKRRSRRRRRSSRSRRRRHTRH